MHVGAAAIAIFSVLRRGLLARSGEMVRFLFMTLVILGLIGLATMLAFVLR